jgi:hypothetical protein
MLKMPSTTLTGESMGPVGLDFAKSWIARAAARYIHCQRKDSLKDCLLTSKSRSFNPQAYVWVLALLQMAWLLLKSAASI